VCPYFVSHSNSCHVVSYLKYTKITVCEWICKVFVFPRYQPEIQWKAAGGGSFFGCDSLFVSLEVKEFGKPNYKDNHIFVAIDLSFVARKQIDTYLLTLRKEF
jgi:hypothetical protein